jgi:hypothetical protein
MGNTNNKVTLVFTALDKATATINRVHDRLERVNRPLRNLKAATGKLFGEGLGLTAAKQNLKDIGDGLAQTARNVAVLGAASYGVYRFAAGAVSAADAIGDLAAQTGASGRDIQVFGSLVELAGGSTEDAATALGKLNKSMSLARSGSKEHLKAFRAVGISMDDLKRMTPAQALEKMSDAFSKSNNQGRKLVIGQQLMGKSSAAMVAALSEGSQKIRDQAREMEEDGTLLTPEQLEDADRIDKAFTRLGNTLKGLKNIFGLELGKALEPFINSFRKWLSANKEMLKGEWVKFLKVHLPVIIEGGKVAFKVLGAVVMIVAKAFAWMGHHLGVTGTTMLVLAVILAPLIGSLLSLGGLLFNIGIRALPWVVRGFNLLVIVGRLCVAVMGSLFRLMLANPFVLLAAAVIALGLIIYKNWDKIVAYIKGAWDRIKAAFGDGFFTGMFTLWLEGWKAFGNAILGIVKTIIPDSLMPDWLKNFSFGGTTPATKPTANPATPSAPAAAKGRPVDGAAVAASMRQNAAGAAGGDMGLMGRIELMVSDDRVRARVVGGKPGIDVDVYNGRAMAAS